MAEILSQDEIDQLLTAINEGAADDIYSTSIHVRLNSYDFKHPDKLTKAQIRTISIIHETFARLTTNSLMTQLRSKCHIHVASVDQPTYEEFIRSISTPTTLAIINMDPLKGLAVLEIDPTISFAIIDRLFGGAGGGETEFHHELTDIELNIMEGIIVRMLGNLREAWNRVIDFDLRPRLGQMDTNPQFAQIVPPSEMVVLITLETNIKGVEGIINICIPYLTIEPIVDKLSSLFWFKGTYTPSVNYIEDLPVTLTAEILRREYPLGEIGNWKEETILLPLCHLEPNHCYLRLGDRRVWQCKMLDDEKWFPKKIMIVDQAKMPFSTEGRRMEMSKVSPIVANALAMARVMVSVELGTTEMSVKEIFCMGKGAILELDKLAAEPLDVKANGVLIAKGEVVVIDENFCVRITETEGSDSLFAKPETPTDQSQEQETRVNEKVN